MLSSLLEKYRRYSEDTTTTTATTCSNTATWSDSNSSRSVLISTAITSVDTCSDESSALLKSSSAAKLSSSATWTKVQRQQNHDDDHNALFNYQHQMRYFNWQPRVLPMSSSSSVVLEYWNNKRKRKKMVWIFWIVVILSSLSLLFLSLTDFLVLINRSPSCCWLFLTPSQSSSTPTAQQALLFPSISTTKGPIMTVSSITNSSTISSSSSSSSSSATTKKEEYGEVWLIRHGEKADYKALLLQLKTKKKQNASAINNDTINYDNMTTIQSKLKIIKAMYELNDDGWNRAYHLKNLLMMKNDNNNNNNNNTISLVDGGFSSSSSFSDTTTTPSDPHWPNGFKALYASRPATDIEIYNSYPNFAKDDSGQSLILREYQTLLPISEYMNHLNTINDNTTKATTKIETKFSKSETKQAALDISKAAVMMMHTSTDTDADTGTTNKHNNNSNSNIVLVAWDHCSLPTLIVDGFGCKSDPKCYRCW